MAASAPLIKRPCSSTFVGRAREIELLDHALVAARRGRGSLFVVTGEPGIGKTRLATEFEERCDERGALAIWGRCWEAGGAPAFWPWTQIMRACFRLAPQVTGPFGLKDQLEVLLAEGPHHDTSSAPVDSEPSRFRLFDAAGRFLQAVARMQPLVLLLDDIHTADVPSLQLLSFLARDLNASAILIIATCREAEMQRQPDRTGFFQALARDGRRVALRGLERDEVASLCVNVAERNIPSAVIAAVHEITEGNP
ncbi:MAG TPA: ATP-binding protein, partial [Candidatus Acidoferrales bacterium]|nr:ATP-binding protein [Candidatus Acidoferrales bacterium]